MEEKRSWDKVNSWAEELEKLRAIIDKTELIETTKWGGPVFTINGKNVVGLGGFKHFFTLWFFNGVFLKDERKLLVNANEGVTKALRQWRFTSASEIDEKMILQYLNEAIANEKAVKNIPPQQKSKNFKIPDELKFALEQVNLSDVFSGFSPFKQREFSEYISEAKQEKTKLSRIEKILAMIEKGIGLHDKYR